MNIMREPSYTNRPEPPLAGTLVDVLENAAAHYPEHGIFHVAAGDDSEDFQSYPELLDNAKRMVQVLYRRMLRPKTPLILTVEASRPFLEIFWGCVLGGILPAPLAPMRTPSAGSMEAQKIFHVWEILGAPIVADSSNERAFAVLTEMFKGTGATLIASEALLTEARIVDFLEEDRYTPRHEDHVVLQFSSGSTGMPKGARLTHRNLIANVQAQGLVECATSSDRMVTWLPYFHDFGLFGCHIMPMLAGMDQIKMDPFQFARRPFLWMEKIHEHRASITSATNTGIEHLLAYISLRADRLPKVDLSSLKVWTVGAEMVSAASCRSLQEQLAPMGLAPHVLMPGYGLTETTLAATCHPRNTPLKTFTLDRKALVAEQVARPAHPGENSAEFTSVGKALAYCEIRITGQDGNALPTGRVGIVEVRGDNVIADYFNNPEATETSFNHDWFSTGDMGFIDAEGDLCIVGRAKEIIIVRGQNYYPADIEHIALSGMENAFRLVVVCGVYDPKVGREIILLFYIPAKKGMASELTPLLHRMNEQVSTLAGFSIDRFISARQGDIPRTSSGKVMRKALCEGYLNGDFDSSITLLEREEPATDPASMDHDQVVLQVWSDILELPVEAIGRKKNLFRLGGDSIRAMRIQARLEDMYRAKMESNFCYLFPTVDQQVQYFRTRDFSIEPPQNEIEALLQKVVASSLGLKAEAVSVSAELLPLVGDMAKAFALFDAIRKVFADVEIGEDFLRLTTIRQMADYLWPKVFGDTHADREITYFPLMHFQETLYFHRKGFVQNEPSGLSCYIYVNARMDGDFRADLFDQALNSVIRRHPIMRAVIDEEREKPRFKIFKTVPEIRARHIDMSHLPPDEERAYILRRGLELNDWRFELDTWPLFFYEVTHFAQGRYAFSMNIDHLLVDGYSYMQIFDEVFNTYDRMVLGEPCELPAPPMTFGDYVRVENLRQRTQEYREALEFQLELFKDLPPKALLPTKQNPALLKEVFFDTFYQEIRPEIIAELNAIAAEEQISLNALLLAAYFKLMNLWCHQDDMIINMPVFNREQYFAGARKTVGSFIDIFPVRLQTRFDEPIIHIARKAETFTRKLLEVPVSSIELSRELFERQGLRATSMSSIIFSNSIGMYAGEVSGMKSLRLETPEFRTGAPGTFIDLVIYDYHVRRDDNDTFYFNWNYIRDLFDREFIETLAKQYHTLLEQIIRCRQTPDLPFSGVDLVPARYHALITRVNETKTPIPESTLHALIAEQIRHNPDNEAISCQGQSFSYTDFGSRAGQVARLLRQLGVATNQFVALFMHRSFETLVGQLGIMQAGGAYLPIAVDYPADRIAYILEDSGAKVLLTQSAHLGTLANIASDVAHILVMDEGADMADIPASLRNRIILPADIYRDRPEWSLAAGSPDDLAYMIYTSGSTGKPKGAMISHRNIVNFLTWVKEGLGITAAERFAFVTSYAFDMTMTSNWTPFLAGASLHVLAEEETKDVNTLLRFISEKGITFLNVTPSHFSLLASAREFLAGADIPLPETMRIMLGGETISTQDLNLWLKHYPAHRFINEYGPTEATVASTFFRIPVNANNQVDLPVIPIGQPVFNTQIYVLNRFREHCMPGVPGELYIGGMGVSQGYHNRPEKNAEAFVPDSFNAAEPKGRLYRTGDLVRMLDTGDLEFLGREDHQINLRGYRIEAGEIESALREHEAVTEAVVAARKDTAGSLTLVAFYTGSVIASPALREHLAQRVPEYMIPAHFEHLDAMPCTPSGKLDRNQLPEVVIESGPCEAAVLRPVTELEKRITAIWEEVLGVTGLGMTSNFWDVGGDSLKAMRLIMRMKKEGFIDFGLKEAFAYQTVASIVSRIARRDGTSTEETGVVTLVEASAPELRLFCLPYACGNPTMFRHFASLLPSFCTVLAANLPGHGKTGEALSSIPEMAALCVEQLAAFDDGTPLVLLGYSFGGFLAYEIARRLEVKGRPASGVVLVASPPPGVTGGLRAILDSPEEEIIRITKEVYHYDFSEMTTAERQDYLRTLKIDTRAMLDFVFGKPVSAPMLNLVGEAEEETELRTLAKDWNTVFANAAYRQIGGAHMLIKTHVDELAATTSDFIHELLHQKVPA